MPGDVVEIKGFKPGDYVVYEAYEAYNLDRLGYQSRILFIESVSSWSYENVSMVYEYQGKTIENSISVQKRISSSFVIRLATEKEILAFLGQV